MEENLKGKTKKGLYWSFFNQFSNYGMNFIVGIVMARLLSPTDYGITALPAVFMAVATGVSLFMTFKDMKMKYHKWINTIAASTFGVLLLHANSDTMRQWLWRDTLQNAEQFYMSYACVHAMISVITIFAICIAIDYIRIHTLEKWMFIVIDKYLAKYKLK